MTKKPMGSAATAAAISAKLAKRASRGRGVRGLQGAGQAPLGNLRNILPGNPVADSTPTLGAANFETDEQKNHRQTVRAQRFELRKQLRTVTQMDRLKACGVRKSRNADGVSVQLRNGRASMSGLQTCGSVWVCPPCAAAVRTQRATEVADIGLRHVQAGGRLLFVTVTLSHLDQDRLASTFDAVSGTWSSLWEGRFRQEFSARFGLVGQVRALEITHGQNGWHPHLHVLLLIDPRPDAFAPATNEETNALTPTGRVKRSKGRTWTCPVNLTTDEMESTVKDILWDRWQRGIAKHGYTAKKEYGIKVQEVTAMGPAFAEYLSKVQDDFGNEKDMARELTRGDLKKARGKGRTPFQIGQAAAEVKASGSATCRGESGDTEVHYEGKTPRDLALWLEFEEATRGRQAITFSAGLRDLFELDELDDEAIVNQEEDGDVELTYPLTGMEIQACGYFDAFAGLLTAMENRGVDGVQNYLFELCARYARHGRHRVGDDYRRGSEVPRERA